VLLADDIDASRGCTLAPVDQAPLARKEIRAKLCWLDHTPLEHGKMYVLQHGVNRVRAKIAQITTVIDVTTQQASPMPSLLRLNEIGEATLRLAQSIFADVYADNPANGAFILIDEWSNTTAGVGFVEA
jgi:sulfate adenylyltransferase subunit 1